MRFISHHPRKCEYKALNKCKSLNNTCTSNVIIPSVRAFRVHSSDPTSPFLVIMLTNQPYLTGKEMKGAVSRFEKTDCRSRRALIRELNACTLRAAH